MKKKVSGASLKTKSINLFSSHQLNKTLSNVIKVIDSLDLSKSTGPYSIPKQILKSNVAAISTILTKLFNFSLQIGKFPKALKLAKTIPIFKNRGSSSDQTLTRSLRKFTIK